MAASQEGVVSLDQLGDAGLAPRASQHRAKVGRLHRVHRGVYAVGHASIGRRGELLAALLACGNGSVISHVSAANLWGLRDRAPTLIDVTGPDQRGRKIDGIRVHRCRIPGSEEVTAHDGISSTTPSRTLVDLAGMLGRKSLLRAVEQAAVLRILDIAMIDAAMDRGKGRRGMPLLREILDPWRTKDLIVPRVRSLLEAKLLPMVIAHGLPRPLCNHKLWVEGRAIEVDLFWPEQRLVVESDGYAAHGTKAAFERDPRRDQDLLLGGYRVARFTWDQVEREPGRTVATIAQLLD
ncbi:MAG TPA: DUF559 domain-containing protein [Solirubrobacterales bacterium]